MIVLVHAVDAKGLPRCPTRRRASCLGLGLDAVVIHEPLGPALVDRRRRRRRRLGRAALLCRSAHRFLLLLPARLRLRDGVARLIGRPLALGLRLGVRRWSEHAFYVSCALGLGGSTSGFFRRLRGLRGCVVVLFRVFACFFACIAALLFGHPCLLHLSWARGSAMAPGYCNVVGTRRRIALHYSLCQIACGASERANCKAGRASVL